MGGITNGILEPNRAGGRLLTDPIFYVQWFTAHAHGRWRLDLMTAGTRLSDTGGGLFFAEWDYDFYQENVEMIDWLTL